MHAIGWIGRAAVIWTIAAGTIGVQAAESIAGADVDRYRWARWQGRLTLGTTPPAWRIGVEGPTVNLSSSATLMGDYYFTRSLASSGRLGGFRATSGLVIGTRGTADSFQTGMSSGSAFSIGTRPLGQVSLGYPSSSFGAEATTVPYVGLGYTGMSLRSGLSLSADLGLAAQPSGGVRLGRTSNQGSGLDDAVRDLRLAPLVQFGVSYSF